MLNFIVLYSCFLGKGAKERSRAAAQGSRQARERVGSRQGNNARQQGEEAGQGIMAGQGSRAGSTGQGSRAAGQGSKASGQESRAGQGSRSGQQAKFKLQTAAEGRTFVKTHLSFVTSL